MSLFARVIKEMRELGMLIFFLAASSGCAADDPAIQSKEVPMASPKAVSEEMIAVAKADAAQRSGKSVAEITLVSAERVTWSNSAMGCPMPGRMYTQALVPGYRIVLSVGEQKFNYHAGSKGDPTFCPPDRANPPAASGDASGTT